jgi:hypothetical protein
MSKLTELITVWQVLLNCVTLQNHYYNTTTPLDYELIRACD